MENVSINTSQNVNLNYRAAGLGLRIMAVILDTIFKYVYFFLVFLIFYNAFLRTTYNNSYYNSESGNQMIYALLVLCLLPAFLYNLLCETFLNGQSFGKKIMRTKVVKLDGTQPNFGSYLIRSMFRLIDDGVIGIITIAVSKNAQRFGDMVAGTTVIELNKTVSLDDTILRKQKKDYKIVYTQVSLLSDKDANTIKEVLEFAEENEKPEHLKLLCEKIRAKYGIHTVTQNDADFLKTILEDYTHYQFEN